MDDESSLKNMDEVLKLKTSIRIPWVYLIVCNSYLFKQSSGSSVVSQEEEEKRDGLISTVNQRAFHSLGTVQLGIHSKGIKDHTQDSNERVWV